MKIPDCPNCGYDKVMIQRMGSGDWFFCPVCYHVFAQPYLVDATGTTAWLKGETLDVV